MFFSFSFFFFFWFSLLYLYRFTHTLSSHKYLSLPLIPVEQYLDLFPEHADQDEHELMISRINHEHAEREKLEQARQELLKRKQALIAENKKRKDDLANLDQDLERFVDVCSLPYRKRRRKEKERKRKNANARILQAAKPIQKIFEKEY